MTTFQALKFLDFTTGCPPASTCISTFYNYTPAMHNSMLYSIIFITSQAMVSLRYITEKPIKRRRLLFSEIARLLAPYFLTSKNTKIVILLHNSGVCNMYFPASFEKLELILTLSPVFFKDSTSPQILYNFPMSIIISFLPWIIFGYVAHHNFQLAVEIALIGSVLITLPDIIHNKVKLLDAGTMIFFVGLLIASIFTSGKLLSEWTQTGSYTTLFLIAFISILAKQPFTYQYAKEQVEEQYWKSDLFIKTNYVITAVWTIGFGLMILVSILSHVLNILPIAASSWTSIIVTVFSSVFTAQYPDYVKKKAVNLQNHQIH